MNEKLYLLWLISLKGVSDKIALTLHNSYGSYEKVYNLSSQELFKDADITPALKDALSDKSLEKAREILNECEEKGIEILSYFDAEYPRRLKQISNPPAILYVKGVLPDIDNSMTVAVVGSRSPSLYGTQTAQKLAYEMAKAGIIIISGMARGIDSAAHRSALRAEEKTIAVLGCGVDVVYPAENSELKQLIENNGAVISEFPPGTSPLPQHFPSRNRIISGLSCGTLVVEGKATSGSTITARLALDQGREVYCVPGNIDNPLSMGPNLIIRDGGTLITCTDDIITGLTSYYPEIMLKTVLNEEKIDEKKLKSLSPDQRKIMEILEKTNQKHIDEICFKTGLDVFTVQECMFMLEAEKLVRQLPGRNYILC